MASATCRVVRHLDLRIVAVNEMHGRLLDPLWFPKIGRKGEPLLQDQVVLSAGKYASRKLGLSIML